MERRDLADPGTGIPHPNFAHRIPAAGNGFPVFHEDGTERHGEKNVVVTHIVPDAFGGILRAEPLIQEVAGGGHEECVHAVVKRIALGIIIGVKAIELPVPGQNAKVPVPVIIGVHCDDGVGLGSHDRCEVLIIRPVGVISQFPAKLGGIGNPDLGEAAAFSVDLLFPENRQDGIVEIVLNVPRVEPAIEINIRVKGDRLIFIQQAGVPGSLNDLKDLCGVVQTDGAITGGIGFRTGNRVFGERRIGLCCGGRGQKRQKEDQTQKAENKERSTKPVCGPGR